MTKITIFTPTYNRAYLLKRLYDSIKVQPYSNFEWIIVDDGSNDNTKELINEFINENIVNIKYFYQENSGKHIAINRGVEEASGELFYIVDSDDYIPKNALNIIDKWEKTIIEKDKFAGVAGLKVDEDNKIMGTTFSTALEYVDATSLEREIYNITGEKAEVFYTQILKQYKFPKIEGEKFITEAYIWNKMANDGYKLRWFNENIMICKYMDDGLTKNLNKINEMNPKGYLLFLLDDIKYEKSFFKKIKKSYWYVGLAKKIYSKQEIKKQLKIGNIKFNCFLLLYRIRCFIRKEDLGGKNENRSFNEK